MGARCKASYRCNRHWRPSESFSQNIRDRYYYTGKYQTLAAGVFRPFITHCGELRTEMALRSRKPGTKRFSGPGRRLAISRRDRDTGSNVTCSYSKQLGKRPGRTLLQFGPGCRGRRPWQPSGLYAGKRPGTNAATAHTPPEPEPCSWISSIWVGRGVPTAPLRQINQSNGEPTTH